MAGAFIFPNGEIFSLGSHGFYQSLTVSVRRRRQMSLE